MSDIDFLKLSFLACIAFAILAVLCLLASGFLLGDASIMLDAILVVGASYAAQTCYTFAPGLRLDRRQLVFAIGVTFQIVAIGVFLIGAWRVYTCT